MATTATRSSEQKKLIAAIVLGLVAILALYFAFGRGLFGGSSAAAVKPTPTPRPNASPSDRVEARLPTADEQNFIDVTTPIDYRPGGLGAPDPGRNIFAFYEPPPPTPYSPTPVVTAPIKTPSPTPPPAFLLGYVNPQTVYAGQNGFRLEVNGDRFEPGARIYFNQTEFPTTFVNAQKLFADIPANMIATEGPRQIIVQLPDGTKYSNQFILSIMAPPRPGFQYIGMIGRKRFNNDTGYFMESNKPLPTAARLNDIVGGRFRLIRLTPAEALFEDTTLGFKHRIAISQATPGTATGGPGTAPGFGPGGFPGSGVNPNDPGFRPMQPGNIPPGDIPGIPSNIPRAPVPTPQRPPNDPKKDVDDDGDGF